MPSGSAEFDLRRFERAAGAAATIAFTAAVLVAIVAALGRGDLMALLGKVPTSAAFWVTLAFLYAIPVLADWLIYRRLWGLPPSGVVPLLRRQVANELVVGYSGDAQLFLWARRHSAAGSPLAAIKDVSILSAAVANAGTILLTAICWPALKALFSGPFATATLGSVLIITVSPLGMFLLRKKLFSLTRRELRFVATVHAVRITGYLICLALLVRAFIPDVGLHALLVVVTLRMIVSRLPLLPGKDIIFAGLVGLLVGKASSLVAVLALVASCIIALHALVGLVVLLPSRWLRDA